MTLKLKKKSLNIDDLQARYRRLPIQSEEKRLIWLDEIRRSLLRHPMLEEDRIAELLATGFHPLDLAFMLITAINGLERSLEIEEALCRVYADTRRTQRPRRTMKN